MSPPLTKVDAYRSKKAELSFGPISPSIDLFSQEPFGSSIFGADAFHFSVRDGKRWFRTATDTRVQFLKYQKLNSSDNANFQKNYYSQKTE